MFFFFRFTLSQRAINGDFINEAEAERKVEKFDNKHRLTMIKEVFLRYYGPYILKLLRLKKFAERDFLKMKRKWDALYKIDNLKALQKAIYR